MVPSLRNETSVQVSMTVPPVVPDWAPTLYTLSPW